MPASRLFSWSSFSGTNETGLKGSCACPVAQTKVHGLLPPGALGGFPWHGGRTSEMEGWICQPWLRHQRRMRRCLALVSVLMEGLLNGDRMFCETFTHAFPGVCSFHRRT